MILALRYWQPLAIAAALLAGWLYVHGLESKVAHIPALEAAIKAEHAARERDVAALTSLSSGLAKAATDSRTDAKILAETVNGTPTPASPALAAFLAGLRKADAGAAAATPGASR